MKSCIVSICNTSELAMAVDHYCLQFLDSVIESYHFTFNERKLSQRLIRQTDLFILELLAHDDVGYYAAAIPVAEKWLKTGKKVLIVSGAAKSMLVDVIWYWDLGAKDPLYERIARLLETPLPHPGVFAPLREIFSAYCRKPVTLHH